MTLTAITNEDEHDEALRRINALMDLVDAAHDPVTPDSIELLRLVGLVEEWEREHYRMDS